MITFIISILFAISTHTSQVAPDPCALFDSWIGGERFNYVVDSAGNWNLPADVEIMATMTFPKSGVWKYYSASQDMSYVIVFRDFDITQPIGARAGQHNICVYRLDGLGIG